MTCELARAYATLHRGADFFATWLGQVDAPMPGAVSATIEHRSKVIANGLRELDRFLNILIDHVSLHHGFSAAPRRRNTAGKLKALRTALGLPHHEHARLLALGRSRDCLFYCGGMVKRGDTRQAATMTLGWPAGSGPPHLLHQVPIGSRIAVAHADLDSVCRFYRRIGDDLFSLAVHGSAGRSPVGAFPTGHHVERALDRRNPARR